MDICKRDSGGVLRVVAAHVALAIDYLVTDGVPSKGHAGGQLHADALRYRTTLEPLLEAMCVYDLEAKRYVYANDAMLALRGATGLTLEEAFPPDGIWMPESVAFLGRVTPRRIAAFLAGEKHRYVDELAMKRLDGTIVWTEVRSCLSRDVETDRLLVSGCLRPIHLEDRTTEPFDDQPRLFDELQSLVSVGLWNVDPVRGNGHWSEKVAEIHEVAVMSDVGELLSQLDNDAGAALAAAQARTLETGEPYTLEVPIRVRSGQTKWIRIHGRAVFEHGTAVRIRGTTEDITERKTFELRLANERALLQSLLDHLPEAVALKDLDGRMLACNARLERLFGVGRGELVGKQVQEYASEEVAKVFQHEDEVARTVDETTRAERWLTFADGHRELCETVTAPVRDRNGKIIGTLRIARNVTANREAEERLRASQKMEAAGRIAGGVAHEFNNVLSVILAYAQLASDALDPTHQVQDDLGEVRVAAKRAEVLTRQLLAFSRRQLLKYRPLRVNEVIASVGEVLRPMIGEDIRLTIENDPQLHLTNADHGQIEQVIMNLVVNASDAMPNGGQLLITTQNCVLDAARADALGVPAGEYVELSVKDTGIGIEAAALPSIFDPFYTTKAASGLGLSMVYGIVKQTGGGVSVESAPGTGTAVSIYLPKLLDRASAAPTSGTRRGGSGTETILIVEDEDALRAVAKRVLARAGYRTILASTAEEALRVAQAEGDRIDVVFTDVVLPGMHGGELVRRLAPLCPKVKVIFTSGYTDETLAQSGVGDHFFIPKPYDPRRLLTDIRRVLDDGRQLSGAMATHAPE